VLQRVAVCWVSQKKKLIRVSTEEAKEDQSPFLQPKNTKEKKGLGGGGVRETARWM
jgi:hypothetical protein